MLSFASALPFCCDDDGDDEDLLPLKPYLWGRQLYFGHYHRRHDHDLAATPRLCR